MMIARFSPIARILTGLGMASALSVLSGCASSLNTAKNDDFSCPGYPGVICKTPVQVYEMTDGALPENGVGIAGIEADKEKSDKNPAPSAAAATASAPSIVQPQKMLQPVTGAPLPVREQARIMRIWIAPWVESKTDALHWPSYVYVEVEPRKWNFGINDFRGFRTGIPLMHKPNPADVPPAPAPSSNGSTGAADAMVSPSGGTVSGAGTNPGPAIPSFE